jgi:hypothetical protein
VTVDAAKTLNVAAEPRFTGASPAVAVCCGKAIAAASKRQVRTGAVPFSGTNTGSIPVLPHFSFCIDVFFIMFLVLLMEISLLWKYGVVCRCFRYGDSLGLDVFGFAISSPIAPFACD